MSKPSLCSNVLKIYEFLQYEHINVCKFLFHIFYPFKLMTSLIRSGKSSELLHTTYNTAIYEPLTIYRYYVVEPKVDECEINRKIYSYIPAYKHLIQIDVNNGTRTAHIIIGS